MVNLRASVLEGIILVNHFTIVIISIGGAFLKKWALINIDVC